MNGIPVPVLVISKCLGFAACRWDGQTVSDDVIDKLRRHARVFAVCPEMEIGLGCPREKIRLIGQEGDQRLVQPATGLDLTVVMKHFAMTFLGSLDAAYIDGFVLKSRSPSCGLRDTKVFETPKTDNIAAHSSGLFARAVVDMFPGHPVEDETRLADSATRRDFLTRIYSRVRERAKSRTGEKGETRLTAPDIPEELL